MISHMAPGFREFEISRWDLSPDEWSDALDSVGFEVVSAEVLLCPNDCHYGPGPGILIVCGRRRTP